MDSLRRASGFLFYALGAVVILGIVLLRRGTVDPLALQPILNVLDLPLVFLGMLYGGSSLVSSLSRERHSPMLIAVVFVPLLILFVVLAWMNFGLPFMAEV